MATHPQIVERLAHLAQIPVRYPGWEQDGELKGAIVTWGATWPCPRTCSSAARAACLICNAEIILPIAADAQVIAPSKRKHISLH